MLYSLIDMLNLAGTRLILGSGYSSYSEVAAQIGGVRGKPLPILLAGRDFGKIIDRWAGRERPAPVRGDGIHGLSRFIPAIRPVVQHYWPMPF